MSVEGDKTKGAHAVVKIIKIEEYKAMDITVPPIKY